MRILTLIIFIFNFSLSIYSQQFHSLTGVENAFNKTYLIYRLGSDYQMQYNPIYKFDTETKAQQLIMYAYRAHYPGGELAKNVNDFEFFPNDANNFINVGMTIAPDNHGYIARNDSTRFGSTFEFDLVEISQQNPSKVFVSGGGKTYFSLDGGYTWNHDSSINYFLLSLSPFNDNIMFGLSNNNQLVKSIDGGNSYTLVDTASIFFDNYLNFLYEADGLHIYRVNRTYGKYTFYVSSNNGDAFTWSSTFESSNPIFITKDPNEVGVIYLVADRNIFKSTDFGYNFSLYKSLSGSMVGIYKKPNSEKLYAATRSMIFEITPTTIQIIKALPIGEDAFLWFPLKIGNRWIYSSYLDHYNPVGPPTYEFLKNSILYVEKDTIINGRIYFSLVNDLLTRWVIGFENRAFIRVDSVSGYYYKFIPSQNSEALFFNPFTKINDTTMNYYRLRAEDTINIFGISTIRKHFWLMLAVHGEMNILKKFGLQYSVIAEFGGSIDSLKGCVIDGIVYGDTSIIVGVEDDSPKNPASFALYQNYPNPFNSSTVIKYELQVPSVVSLKVIDVLGREVAILVDKVKEAGKHSVTFDTRNTTLATLKSGVYFYQLKAGSYVETKKMIYLK